MLPQFTDQIRIEADVRGLVYPFPATARVARLLDEIEADPTGILWG